MKRLNKKGFTIVELVIVIAVIAILAATLIPTFSNVINKANQSADTQLVRNLNTILLSDKASGKNHETMQSALDCVADSGYDVAKIMTAKATDNTILWDETNDVFCYQTEDGIVNIPDSTVSPSTGSKLWKVYSSIEAANATGETCSIYLAGSSLTGTITVTSRGIDVGKNTLVGKVVYNGGTNINRVVIRTNNFDTEIEVNETVGDSINHYGLAGKLITTNLTTNSYHEYGKLTYAYITKGRVVAEDKGVIEVAYVSDEVAYAQEKDTGVINVAYASSNNVKTASDVADSINGTKKELTYDSSITSEEAESFVARIGSKGYKNLQDAFNDVVENGIINLTKNIESNQGFKYDRSYTSTLDLNEYTLKVTGSISSIDGGRAIKIYSGRLIAKNGTVDGRSYNTDGTPHDNPSSQSPWSSTRTGGCFRLSGGDAELENLIMYNNDGWGNCVKMESDNNLIMKNCTVNSVYGAGLEQGYGTADLYNCTFYQTGLANNKYMSTCFAVCGLGTLNLHNVIASQNINENNCGYGTYVLYVYNSGGCINVDGGTFISKGEAVVHVDGATLASYLSEEFDFNSGKNLKNNNVPLTNEEIKALTEQQKTEIFKNYSKTDVDNAIEAYDTFMSSHNGKSSIVVINGGTFVGTMYKTTTGEAAVYADIVDNR